VTSPLRVRYIDPHLIVVDKPFGLATQGGQSADLYQLLLQEHDYLGLHHRLDQAASGLVLLTRRKDVNKAISLAFKRHKIARRYRAVLTGRLDEAQRWEWPIDGRPAGSIISPMGYKKGMSAVAIELETGRTHQIRKHAAMAGYPVAGDRRYGGDSSRNWPRLALHAYELSLEHPVSGEQITIRSPLPDDLVELWNGCTHPGESREPPKP
jgi:23S rRNA pseudouridine955/2504/2580 synthase